jgi:lysozyme family protein
MTRDDLDAGALWVASFEGPYHVSPGDPGGATAFGISLRYHAADFTDAQLRALSVNEAASFLAARYAPDSWLSLPSYLATPLIAFSVLEGPVQAAMALQRALGVHADGDVGPQTAAAALKPTPKALLTQFYRECMERLHTRPTWVLEGTGWECRQFAASLEAATGWKVETARP